MIKDIELIGAPEQVRRAAALSTRLLRAADLGVTRGVMSRMERAGEIHRVIAGVYVGASCARDELVTAAAWTLRYPASVTCLLTAAVHHRLTDAFPGGTWLYVAKGTTVPRSRTSALNIVQVSPRYIDPREDEANGIVAKRVHGVRVRLTGPDRTVLDLWRYPRRISAEHALNALRLRARASDFRPPAFARLARRLRLWNRVEPVLQGLTLR